MKLCHIITKGSEKSTLTAILYRHLGLGRYHCCYLRQEGYVIVVVCLFVCLYACLLATLRKNLRTDLDETVRERWQWASPCQIAWQLVKLLRRGGG